MLCAVAARVRYKSAAPAHAAHRLIALQLYTNQNVNGYSMLSALCLVIMMLALGILIGWIATISRCRPIVHATRSPEATSYLSSLSERSQLCMIFLDIFTKVNFLKSFHVVHTI